MKQSKVVAKVVLRRPEDGRLLLLRRSEADVRRPLDWDLPGGGVDNGEDFATAAVRETLEEAGIVIDQSGICLAYSHTEMTERGNTRWLIFIDETTMTDVKLSHEHDKFYWATETEALEMITYERQHKALQYIFYNKLFE